MGTVTFNFSGEVALITGGLANLVSLLLLFFSWHQKVRAILLVSTFLKASLWDMHIGVVC